MSHQYIQIRNHYQEFSICLDNQKLKIKIVIDMKYLDLSISNRLEIKLDTFINFKILNKGASNAFSISYIWNFAFNCNAGLRGPGAIF